jgi:hypothetical protein
MTSKSVWASAGIGMATASVLGVMIVISGPPKVMPPSVASGLVADIAAESCSLAHVTTAVGAVTDANDDGLTVMRIPAGTCNWEGRLQWHDAPDGAVLVGAGDLAVLGGGDATVIVDDNTTTPTLIELTGSSGTLRVAGLTIQGGSGSVKDFGALFVRGPAAIRVDHVHLNMQTYSNTTVASGTKALFTLNATGVLDSSIIDVYGNSALYIYNEGADQTSSASWAAVTGFGTSDYFFYEDNQIRGDVSTALSRLSDCFTGARQVVRFNTLSYSNGPEIHATGANGDARGCRSIENYGNRFSVLPEQPAPATNIHDAKGGTALVWGNTVDASAVSGFVVFNVTRRNADTYAQTGTPNDFGFCGTEHNGTGSNWDGNTNASTGYPCLDQPGRGQSNLVTGYFPTKVNQPTGTIAWPDQALEPIYIWMLSGTPTAGSFPYHANNSGGRVTANVDYYPQASGVQTTSSSPFDGTVGTGWGTIANRPSTCTAGVGYFATDEGSWNTSTSNPLGTQFNGADGRLYLCTSANTWTLYYTPYTYPHPLRGGS